MFDIPNLLGEWFWSSRFLTPNGAPGSKRYRAGAGEGTSGRQERIPRSVRTHARLLIFLRWACAGLHQNDLSGIGMFLPWCRREASFRVDLAFHDNHAVNLETARSLHEACEKLALVLSRSVAVKMNSTAQPALNRPCWWLSCVAVFTISTCRDQTICAQYKCKMPSVAESSRTHHQTTASSPTARRCSEALKALCVVVHLDHRAGWCLEKTAWSWTGTKLLVCHLHRSNCTKFVTSTAKWLEPAAAQAAPDSDWAVGVGTQPKTIRSLIAWSKLYWKPRLIGMEELLPVSDAFSSHSHLPTTLWLHCESWLWSSTPTVAFRLRAFKIERTLRWKDTDPFANPLLYIFIRQLPNLNLECCALWPNAFTVSACLADYWTRNWLRTLKRWSEVTTEGHVGSTPCSCQVVICRAETSLSVPLKWIANRIVSCSTDRLQCQAPMRVRQNLADCLLWRACRHSRNWIEIAVTEPTNTANDFRVHVCPSRELGSSNQTSLRHLQVYIGDCVWWVCCRSF